MNGVPRATASAARGKRSIGANVDTVQNVLAACQKIANHPGILRYQDLNINTDVIVLSTPEIAGAAQEPTVTDASTTEPVAAVPQVTAQAAATGEEAAADGAVEDEFNQRWFMAGSLLTIGILGGGLLIASLVYAYQHMGQR